MKFADGTYVGGTALDDNQVKVTAAIQSFCKDTDGYDFASNDGYSEIDETVAILYTQTSGLLRIRADHIRNLTTRPEMRTKVREVMKHAGPRMLFKHPVLAIKHLLDGRKKPEKPKKRQAS